MEGLGQATPMLSSISVKLARLACPPKHRHLYCPYPTLVVREKRRRTQRSMLEGESNNVLDSLGGQRGRITGEPLTDDHLDPASIIAGIPVTRVQDFLSEAGELEGR